MLVNYWFCCVYFYGVSYLITITLHMQFLCLPCMHLWLVSAPPNLSFLCNCSCKFNTNRFAGFDQSCCWYVGVLFLCYFLFLISLNLLKSFIWHIKLLYLEGQSETIVEDIENMVRAYVEKVSKYCLCGQNMIIMDFMLCDWWYPHYIAYIL